MKSTGIYNALRQAVSDICCHARSVLKMETSNHVESFNVIIAKVVGSKRINYGHMDSYYVRVHTAVVQYNSQSALSKVTESCGFDLSVTITSMEEIAKNKIQRKKTLRIVQGRRRKRHVENGNEDYGESANRPDIGAEEYEVLRQQHMAKLKKDQDNRVDIERSTTNQSECDLWYQKRGELGASVDGLIDNDGIVESHLG